MIWHWYFHNWNIELKFFGLNADIFWRSIHIVVHQIWSVSLCYFLCFTILAELYRHDWKTWIFRSACYVAIFLDVSEQVLRKLKINAYQLRVFLLDWWSESEVNGVDSMTDGWYIVGTLCCVEEVAEQFTFELEVAFRNENISGPGEERRCLPREHQDNA